MIEELVIPDVPDDIVRLLTEIAMQNNHTLEEEVKDLLYRAAHRAMLKRELGRQMSIISEDASCSTWACASKTNCRHCFNRRLFPNSRFTTMA